MAQSASSQSNPQSTAFDLHRGTSGLERGAMSVRDFCRWAGIGRSLTYELMRSGQLPFIKIGSRRLIRCEDAIFFLASRPEGVAL